MSGRLDILNCTDGHTSFTFNPKLESDVARSRALIEDMMKRGYTFLVDDGAGNLVRAKSFDADKGEYVLESMPPPPEQGIEASGDATAPRRLAKKRVKATESNATVVGRTAGGFPPPGPAALLRMARSMR